MAPIATIVADLQALLGDASDATKMLGDVEKLIADLVGTPQAAQLKAKLSEHKAGPKGTINWLQLIFSILQIVMPLIVNPPAPAP